MIDGQHLVWRPVGNDTLFGQDSDMRRQSGQGVEVVRHHDHGETEFGLQGAKQLDEVAGHVRVQSGGRLVKHQEFRFQRQRPGQRHPLDHATRQFGRHQAAVTRLQFDHFQLEPHQVADQCFIKRAQFTQGKGDVVEHRQGGKQRPLLEQHAEAPPQFAALLWVAVEHRLPKQPHRATIRLQEADHFPQQRRLAAAGTANQPEHLPGLDAQVDITVNQRAAKTGFQTTNFDDGQSGVRRRLPARLLLPAARHLVRHHSSLLTLHSSLLTALKAFRPSGSGRQKWRRR